MKTKTVYLACLLLASTSAMAQAGPVAEKSSDQIVCELTGDCSKMNANDPSLATVDKPENRGFTLAKRTAAPATRAPTASSANVQTARVAAPQGRSFPAQARFSVAHAPSNPGRTNLSINFVSGSAALTDSGRNQAMRVVQALKNPALSGHRFRIGGHTDAVGNADYNLNLSRQRAQAMVDFLTQNGADKSRFEVQGFGFSQPIPGTSAKSAANRRVEIVKLD